LRHRLPVRPRGRAAFHPRGDQGGRRPQAQGRRPAQGLLRQRDPHAQARAARGEASQSGKAAQAGEGQGEEEEMTIPRERVPYSAIVDRPKLKLPAGKRIIVWTIVNLEVWDIAKPMARQVLPPPTGASLLPDVPNWSWHEYGMRVGFWR